MFGLIFLAIAIVLASGGLLRTGGAHMVIDRHKESAVLQGFWAWAWAQELIPSSRSTRSCGNTPHDYRGHHDDFAQYEVSILKLSGRKVEVGLVTVARADNGRAGTRP
jgi:hypothetical protein